MTRSQVRTGSWMSARKLGVGRPAPAGVASRVWWTCVAGGLSEASFPTVDRPAIRGVEVLAELADGTLVEPHARLLAADRRDRRAPDVVLVTAPGEDAWSLCTEPLADPAWDALRVRWRIRPDDTAERGGSGLPVALVVHVEPRLGGTGPGHRAWVEAGRTAVAEKGRLAIAARPAGPAAGALVDVTSRDEAAGRVALTFRLPIEEDGTAELAIGFGEAGDAAFDSGSAGAAERARAESSGTGGQERAADPGSAGGQERAADPGSAGAAAGTSAVPVALAALDASLARSFDDVLGDELGGWRRWAATVSDEAAATRVRDEPLGWESLVLFRVLEDVTHPGAVIASPSRPWSDAGDDRDPAENGYRHVWARDLYHVAMGLLAAGDTAGFLRVANDGLPRLVRPDGFVPQNAAVDGTQAWKAEQLDEVADAILLAWWASQIDPGGAPWRLDRVIRPCANRCAGLGPATRQERWEEQPGYSPSTLAAAIAALVCAADAAHATASAGEDALRWLEAADDWERHLDTWTMVPAGTRLPARPDLGLPAWPPRPAESVGEAFHLRIAPRGRPAAADTMRMVDHGPTVDQRHVLDAGFLELVRVGIRGADDPRILASLARADADLRASTDRGTFWYRYSGDRYGEEAPGGSYPGRGHPWVHLAGERGHWALAAGRRDEAEAAADAMIQSANEGGMLPEQVWEGNGTGTGSATPLGWAHAELLLLRRSLLDGRVFDMPEPVRRRYLGR